MKKIVSSVLTASLALYAAACEPQSDANDIGELSIALTSVPADVACLKVKVEGSRTVTQQLDVVVGAPTNFNVARLPGGIVQVSAQAFAKVCAAVGPADMPSYVTEAPVPVRIDPAGIAQVVLKLLRNGRLSVAVDFEGDEFSCGTCDDKNPCTADSCVAGACAFATVADGTLCRAGNLRVKILGFNDFHGQISAGRTLTLRPMGLPPTTHPVGGAVVLASYLKAASAGLEDQTFIVHAGDHVGATPPASALLQDEPSISFLNLLANASCTFADKANPACNMVGTLGNHEFDEGSGELLRLLDGGKFATGPFLEDPYQGARFPYVSANVVNEVTGQPLLRPYVIKVVRGIKVAFVGAVLKATPTVVTPTGVAGLKFLDEAVAANSYVPELKAAGVKAMVLLIHQGGSQTSYQGPTKTTGTTVNGADILDIVKRLDSEFDVVVSGHAHSFTNALVANSAGKEVLVTQAFSASTAFADIELTLNPVTGDVVTKTASVITTFGDSGPGLVPQPAVAALVAAAEAKVAPLVNEVVGTATVALTRAANLAGEQVLGNVIADAQRANTGTQFAFMNPGGVRADLDAGTITWGKLFTIQPFGNSLVTMQLTGAQIKTLLNQQLFGPAPATIRILSISGLSYTWDQAQPVGSKVVEVKDMATGMVLDPAALYTVTTNNFLAAGGDGFTTFTMGLNQVGGDIDLDAFVDWVKSHNPLVGAIDGRTTRLN